MSEATPLLKALLREEEPPRPTLIPLFEYPPCQVTESIGPCASVAVAYNTKGPRWLLCNDHAMLALIAGWEPRLLNESLNPPTMQRGEVDG